ncbi:MAG: DUF296 domain-containing protein [Byssovorax sp.]
MNVQESNRTRTLTITLDRDEELPVSLIRALGEAEARSAWLVGNGTLEAAEIAVYDQASRTWGPARRIETPTMLVSLTGNAAIESGVLVLNLTVVLARETDAGNEIIAGQLVWARAFAVELCVTAFDDFTLTRTPDERTGLSRLSGRKSAAVLVEPPRAEPVAHAEEPAAPVRAEAPPPVARIEIPASPPGRMEFPARGEAPAVPVRAATPAPAQPKTDAARAALHYGTATAAPADAPTILTRPNRANKQEQMDAYPEIGDAVAHFHFGECTVISSDGDRIRLRQDKDGRVREVALAVLKIGDPTILADGRRHFVLGRKN